MPWKSVQQCQPCWTIENGEREPVRMKAEFREVNECVTCGVLTDSGIYVRRDVP